MRTRRTTLLALPLAVAALFLLSAPAATARAGSDITTSLDGESVTLSTAPATTCDPSAETHTDHLTGQATGPFEATYDATMTTTVSGNQRTTVVTFSIGPQVTGNQTVTAPADDQGPCAELVGTLQYYALIGTTADHGTTTVLSEPGDGVVLSFVGDPGPTPAPSPSTSPTPSPATSPSPSATSSPTAAAPSSGAVTPLTFEYDARLEPDGGYAGGCTVTDGSGSEPVRIVCTDITGYHESDYHVRFTGGATINGTPTTYRIDVTDGALTHQPDVFRIATGTGFVGGGELTGGNLEVN